MVSVDGGVAAGLRELEEDTNGGVPLRSNWSSTARSWASFVGACELVVTGTGAAAIVGKFAAESRKMP